MHQAHIRLWFGHYSRALVCCLVTRLYLMTFSGQLSAKTDSFSPPQGVAMPSVWKQWRWQPRCAPSPGSSGSLSHLMHCFSLRWAIFFKAKHCEEDGSQSSMVVGVSFETKCCRESRLPNKLFLCRFDSIEQLMKPPFCCFALDTSCLILNVTLSPSRSPLCCLY